MAEGWAFHGCYYHEDGGLVGPISLETVAELIARGTLRDWETVLVEWRRGDETRLLKSKPAPACRRGRCPTNNPPRRRRDSGGVAAQEGMARLGRPAARAGCLQH
jgi:hypothetical protein